MTGRAETVHGFDGDKLYQQRARTVLPMLVRQAWSGQPIRYEMLAAEAGISNPRNLNYPLGCIGERLDALADEWEEEIPHIQSLVVGKATGLPGDGFDGFLRRQAIVSFINPRREIAELRGLANLFGKVGQR